MKLIKRSIVMFAVIALSAGAYAMIYVDGGNNVAPADGDAFSLSGAALLFGLALLALGNLKQRREH